jgi:hypothetical protein
LNQDKIGGEYAHEKTRPVLSGRVLLSNSSIGKRPGMHEEMGKNFRNCRVGFAAII